MNRLLHLLTIKLSRLMSTATDVDHDIGNEEDPDESALTSDDPTSHGDLMPDVYGEAMDDTQSERDSSADDDTQPLLQIIDPPSGAPDRSEGFDPYNSGGFKTPKK